MLNIGFLYGNEINDIQVDTDNGPRNLDGDEAFILLQYTGLKDKNGKEIYESDILKKPDSPTYREVKWENCYFYLTQPEGYTDILDITRITHYGYEVVGNIYENPELLEVKL